MPSHYDLQPSQFYLKLGVEEGVEEGVEYSYSDVIRIASGGAHEGGAHEGTLTSETLTGCNVKDEGFEQLLAEYIVFAHSVESERINRTSAEIILEKCGPRTPFYKIWGYEISTVLPVHFSRDSRLLTLQDDVLSYMLYQTQTEATLKAAAARSITNLKTPSFLKRLTYLNTTFPDSTNPYLSTYLDPPYSHTPTTLPTRTYTTHEKVKISPLITYDNAHQTHTRRHESEGGTWVEPSRLVDLGKVEYWDTSCGVDNYNNCINAGFGWIKGNWGVGGRNVEKGLRMFEVACGGGSGCGKFCFWDYVTGGGWDPKGVCTPLVKKHEEMWDETEGDDIGCGFTRTGKILEGEERKTRKGPGQCDDHLLLGYGLHMLDPSNPRRHLQKATRYILEAAEVGNEHAMYLSGMLSYGYRGGAKGEHINWNFKNDYALNCLRVAASYGHAPAVYALGRVEEKEEERMAALREVVKRDVVVRGLKLRAEKGCLASLRLLADAKVEWGMEQSSEFSHLVESSTLGNWKSRLKLGDMFFYNNSLPWYARIFPDDSKSAQIAVQHYRLAASGSGNNAKANWYLGWCYEWGAGVPQDFPMAKRYYDRAREDATNGVIGGMSVQFLKLHEFVDKYYQSFKNVLRFIEEMDVKMEKERKEYYYAKPPREDKKRSSQKAKKMKETKEEEEWRRKGAVFSKNRKKEPPNAGNKKKTRTTHTTSSYFAIFMHHLNPSNDLTIVFVIILAVIGNLLMMYREYQVRVSVESRRLWEDRFAVASPEN
ncbi:hypothetical protein TrST_g6487 [Triparma strigata]|uniref:Uncharacterized protein n=1 Tax=Triparma strigata TaxID=1606541 RepID=A0A9W7ERH2_9STRA|nr:hypothetical protein TrST_g6487 [Triparma strigata]